MKSEIFENLRELLAIATGHNLEEINPVSQLEADLGVNMEDDFPRLMAGINKKFGIELKAEHVLHELEEAGDSVEQLAKLVEEEIELG
jgi:acyl carrier protein